MTNPQSSPPPLPPAYPATVPGRKRIFMDGPIGISMKGPIMYDGCGYESVEGLQSKFLHPEKIMEQHEDIKNMPPSGDGTIDINRYLQAFDESFVSDESMLRLLKAGEKPQLPQIIPYEKLEGPIFPLDLLKTSDEVDISVIAAFGTDANGIAYVGNEKVWSEPNRNKDSFFMGNKTWDDEVGQYTITNQEKSEMSIQVFIENIRNVNKAMKRVLHKLQDYGTDFVGRSGEM